MTNTHYVTHTPQLPIDVYAKAEIDKCFESYTIRSAYCLGPDRWIISVQSGNSVHFLHIEPLGRDDWEIRTLDRVTIAEMEID